MEARIVLILRIRFEGPMTSCSYSFDSNEWQEEHGIDIEEHWTWNCPHEQYGDDYDRCLFHMSEDSRTQADIYEEELRERFIKDVLRGDENRLHGAVLEDLALDFLSLRNIADQPINLRANSFQKLSFTNAQVNTAIRLDYSIFEDLDFSHAVVDHALALQRVEIAGSFSAKMADLDRIYGSGMIVSECDLSDSQITRVAFYEVHIDEFRCPYATLSIILDGATFYDEFTVSNAVFEKVVDCRNATFKCQCHIYKADFQDNLRMEESRFNEGLEVEDSTLGGIGLKDADVIGDLRISSSTMDTLILDETNIKGELWIGGTFEDRVQARKTTCEDDVRFNNVTTDDLDVYDLNIDQLYISSEQVSDLQIKSSDLQRLQINDGEYETIGLIDSDVRKFSIGGSKIGFLQLVEATVNGNHLQNRIKDTTFSNAEIDNIAWRGKSIGKESEINFVGGSLNEGDLHQPDEGKFQFIFYQTTIGDIRFHNSDGDDLQHVHFISAEFDQFPFSDYTEELAPTWQLSVGRGLDSSELASDSGKLEEYQTHRSARASAESSNLEDARSGLYKQEMKLRGQILWSRWSDGDDLGSLSKWFELQVLKWICGYGEDPGQPILIAIGTMALFSMIYAGMLYETSKTVGDSIVTGFILSMQAFATLVFSPDPEFSGVLGRLLTSLEGVIATLLIPFLVFALTKSID